MTRTTPGPTLDGRPGTPRPAAGAEQRSRTIRAGVVLAIAAGGLLLLASVVLLSPSPPSQNVNSLKVPPVVGTSPAARAPAPAAPVPTTPASAASTTTSPSTTTTVAPTSTDGPVGAASGSTGTRPATLSETAAIEHQVPPPAGYLITAITVSQSDPAWAVESVRPIPPAPRPTTAPGTAPTSSTPPTTTPPTTTPPSTPPATVGVNPIANVLIQELGGTWREVEEGRPLAACPAQLPAEGADLPGEAPNQVTLDLAAFLNPCG